MQDPLKQGLKQGRGKTEKPTCPIRMQDPLKQGLKLVGTVKLANIRNDSNARSIKTRIETVWIRAQATIVDNSNARSIKTRIETCFCPC